MGDDPNFATTTANSIGTKLPKSGGQMTGNITFSGSQTVDGRDLSVDGAKLDGIAAGATNVTNNNQLTNGAGYITNANGGNANQLDGIDSSQFLRSDTADTATGDITFSSGAGAVTINGGSDIRLGSGNWTGEANAKLQHHNAALYIQYPTNLIFRNSSSNNRITVNHDGDLNLVANLIVGGTGQYTGAQRGSVGSHTLNGSISLNLNERNNYKFTLSGNGVLSNPSNQTAGQHGVIELVQDGTGGRTVSFGSNWKFPGGTAPTLSTAANAQDLLAYYVAASGTIYAQLIVDLK